MEMNRYQIESQDFRRFGAFPDDMPVLAYVTLGLVGESGEIADKVKKLYRDAGGEIDGAARVAILLELGDALWYVAALAQELDSSLGQVAQLNLAKLTDRAAKGAIHGSGDNR